MPDLGCSTSKRPLTKLTAPCSCGLGRLSYPHCIVCHFATLALQPVMCQVGLHPWSCYPLLLLSSAAYLSQVVCAKESPNTVYMAIADTDPKHNVELLTCGRAQAEAETRLRKHKHGQWGTEVLIHEWVSSEAVKADHGVERTSATLRQVH
jgi:hypothetical protein